MGSLLFGYSVVLVTLTIEVILLQKRLQAEVPSSNRSPEEVFADGILQYAGVLAGAGTRRDAAVIELRGWSTRLLHLIGAKRQRTELGQLALTAAITAGDEVTQISILVDDLGWAMHELGDDKAAIENLDQALAIVGRLVANPGNATNETLLDLKLKALRHKANINSRSLAIDAGRALFVGPRAESLALPSPLLELHRAQIDHSEAELILNHIDANVGENGQVDPTGQLNVLLKDALELSEAAENAFAALTDHEREAKALALRVRLLAHERNKQRYLAAETRLSRLQQEVARHPI
jgi:hypothetical protein